MAQWDEAHWQMVARTIDAILERQAKTISSDQTGTILHGCREVGWQHTDIEHYIASCTITPAPAPDPPGLGSVEIVGRQFGWNWRGMSAFKLGAVSRDEALRFLDFAAENGVNVLRLFGRTAWVDGWTLPQTLRALDGYLLEEAAARDIRLQLAVWCDTNALELTPLDWTKITREEIAPRARDCPHLIIEGANEPWHETQDLRLAGWVADEFPQIMYEEGVKLWCQGAPREDSGDELVDGPFIVRHTERTSGEDGWRWVRHTRELWDVAMRHGKPIVNSEPSRDDASPTHHWALGVLCRLFGFGDTFHYEGGLRAIPPEGIWREALRARVAGWSRLPGDEYGLYFNAGESFSPIEALNGNALRGYSVHNFDSGFTLLLGVTNRSFIKWRAGWNRELVEARFDAADRSAALYFVEKA